MSLIQEILKITDDFLKHSYVLFHEVNGNESLSKEEREGLIELITVLLIPMLKDVSKSVDYPNDNESFVNHFAHALVIYGEVNGILKKSQSYSDKMRANAKIKVANDPWDEDIKMAFECWQQWQENPTKYKSRADFGRKMADKAKHITDNRTFERWDVTWKSEVILEIK